MVETQWILNGSQTAQIFEVKEKVFDFISIAKSDLSNWYCIHAYFIEIQMVEKYGFSDFPIFSLVFRCFLVELHEFEDGKYSQIALFYDAGLTKTYPKVMKNLKNRKIRYFSSFEFR